MTEEYKRKFSICLRIDKITPAHTYFSIFSAMILEEYEHRNVTRAKAGELCMRREEVVPFIEHLAPHILMFKDESIRDYFEEVKSELKLLYTIETLERIYDPQPD